MRDSQQDGVLAAARRALPGHVRPSRCTAPYYKAFRAPNLAELYRKQVSGDVDHGPESVPQRRDGDGREVGFDWQPIEWIQAKGTFYVADYNDFNVPTNLTATSVPPRPAECGTVATCRTRLNVNKSRSQGGEAYLALRPMPRAVRQRRRELRRRPPAVGPSGDRDRTITKPHINRVPSPKQTIRATWTLEMLGDWTAMWRHEGRTTTLQGVWPRAVHRGRRQRAARDRRPGCADSCRSRTSAT